MAGVAGDGDFGKSTIVRILDFCPDLTEPGLFVALWFDDEATLDVAAEGTCC